MEAVLITIGAIAILAALGVSGAVIGAQIRLWWLRRSR